MIVRNLPFNDSNPNDAGAIAVAESAGFVYFSRDTAQQLFSASWDAMQSLYRLALQQAIGSVRLQRSVLDLRPSLN